MSSGFFSFFVFLKRLPLGARSPGLGTRPPVVPARRVLAAPPAPPVATGRLDEVAVAFVDDFVDEAEAEALPRHRRSGKVRRAARSQHEARHGSNVASAGQRGMGGAPRSGPGAT